MANQILTTDEFDAWLASLTEKDREDILHVVDLLQALGVRLKHPHSSAIESSHYPLRELRPKQGHSPLRVIYAYDPHRDAVLLIGGDKGADKRMYDRIVPVAERLWDRHLTDVKTQDATDKKPTKKQ